jgi:hypothetical protein
LAYASRAPQPDIERLKTRMSWKMPWYTITDSFDTDFGVDERHGHNAFIRDGDSVFRTYFINNRGDEAMGSTWSYLDMTALGRQENWEDSPKGYPKTPPTPRRPSGGATPTKTTWIPRIPTAAHGPPVERRRHMNELSPLSVVPMKHVGPHLVEGAVRCPIRATMPRRFSAMLRRLQGEYRRHRS